MSAGQKEAFQTLESAEADFEKMTWTFRIAANNRVGAGLYTVIPDDIAIRHARRLQCAESILRRICETETEATIGKSIIEAAHAFFDPDPIA